MKKIILKMVMPAAFAVLYPVLSLAQANTPAANCMNESAQIILRLNDSETDVSTIKDQLDKEIAEVKKIAKGLGVDDFTQQSMNYNINQSNMMGRRFNHANGNADEPQYTLGGSVNFNVKPASKAIDIMAALTKKGYNASLNSNSYNNCNSQIHLPVYSPPVP